MSNAEGGNGYYSQVAASATGPFCISLYMTIFVGIILFKKQLTGIGDHAGHIVTAQ